MPVETLKLIPPPACGIVSEAGPNEYPQTATVATVSVTGMVSGEFEAEAEVIVIDPLKVPAARPLTLKFAFTVPGAVPEGGETDNQDPPEAVAV
jgi:hypothetical protein